MRQRSLVASTRSTNEIVSGSVESQYLVGVASPLGHSISSHSFFGFLGHFLLGATATRTRAKREDAVLCEDGERVLCRGWRGEGDGDRTAVLAVFSASEYPTPGLVDRLAHEYG